MYNTHPKYVLGPRVHPRSSRYHISVCTQQAQELQLREELSGPRPSLVEGPNISPLVGAAFSSNWVLFRQVYDSYEKLTRGYWWRSMVRRF